MKVRDVLDKFNDLLERERTMTEQTQPTHTKHMSVTRSPLLVMIRTLGHDVVVPGSKDDHEAIETVQAIPTEFYSSCSCKKNANGSCTGQPEK